MKRTKQEKAITLVALIITIIVLLILAVVTIAAITGDGDLISHANNAKQKYTDAASEENSLVQSYLAKMPEESGASNGEKTYDNASKDANGYLTENAIYTDGESKTATIPSGFKVSETDGEQTISTGLVVKDSAGNEFVWVPVSNINEMAKLQSGSETNYEGILYNFSGTTATEKTNYGIGTEYFREPDTVSNYDENVTYLSTVGCTTTEEFKAQMQTEFNSMVVSVSKYKGFYVARYELSTTSEGKLASKAGATVTTAATNSNRWYGLYNICKTYNVTSSVESNMIYGCQYDAMLRWMLTGEEASKVTTTGNGNHSGLMRTTGSTSTDKINNVYDLEGNLHEYTQEAGATDRRISRGGYYMYGNSAATSNRTYGVPYDNNDTDSARATLYIK